jgi:SpoVK/Ycf46/Vps4 family AAA+-type ATPase
VEVVVKGGTFKDGKEHSQKEEMRNMLAKIVGSERVDQFSNGPLLSSLKRGNYVMSFGDIVDVVDSMMVVDLPTRGANARQLFWQAEVHFDVYELIEQLPEREFLEMEDETISACERTQLPNALFHGLWESIIVEDEIKRKLLGYCSTSLKFSHSGVDTSIVSWNKMIMLYGPPGTGKTSLMRGLAQKAYIRASDLFESSYLMEINCHSLFSKWFSQSGKLVMQLFEHIEDMLEIPSCFVTLLVDEVESIASSRSASSRAAEPGDAIRVVNAVLTALDGLRRRPNIMVLCTSNMADNIDAAFLDRLDMKLFVGNPPLLARRVILSSCVDELEDKGVVKSDQQSQNPSIDNAWRTAAPAPPIEFPVSPSRQFASSLSPSFSLSPSLDSHRIGANVTVGSRPQRYTSVEMALMRLASMTEGLSGRRLRKLALQAHAWYCDGAAVSKVQFFQAMERALAELSGGENQDCIEVCQR